MVSFLIKRNSSACFSITYTKIELIQKGIAWRLCKNYIQIHEVFCIFWGSQSLYDPLLFNTKEIIWIKATCCIQYWSWDFHYQKIKFNSKLPLGPTQSGHSHLSHSFPMILCGNYSIAAILFFLLSTTSLNLPDLCMVHLLLLRSPLKCQDGLSGTVYQVSFYPSPICVLFSSLSLY